MHLKSKFVRVVCSLALILSLVAIAAADTLRLKDGSIIKGMIVSFAAGQFTVVIGEGSRQRRMNFYADEIESIEFEKISLPLAVKTATQLPVKSDANKSTTNKPNNDTVITVGQNDKTTNPTTTTVPKTETNTTTIPSYTNNTPKPLLLSVKVLADNTANGWTNSGFMVKKGDRIKISGKGTISLGVGNYASPNGIGSIADKDKLMASNATGALIAVIGDDNNDFIFVGNLKEFVAARDGALFLGINEGNLDDNSGAFEVSIEISRNE
jgi:hypothetical protein